MNSKTNITKDFYWYFIGTALPMLVLFFRSPIYTRIFSPELFGKYSLIYIAFTYISALSYQSITNNAWRYYNKYKKLTQLNLYMQVIVSLYILIVITLFAGCSIWFMLTKDEMSRVLIFWGFFFALTNELFNTLNVPCRIEGYSKKYNLINSGRAVFSFALLLILTFIFDYTIEAFFISQVIANLLFVIPVLGNLPRINNRLKNSELKAHIFRFIKYGSANLLFNIGLFLLISSDRFVIAFIWGNEKVGIYNQTYNIAQMTIVAVFTVFNSVINPMLLEKLDTRPSTSNAFLVKLLTFSIVLFLPLTILLTQFSKEIVYVLLGEDFREAWNILPYIFFSSLIYGITYFSEVKLKFQNQLKILFRASLFCALINISLNLIFVSKLGYKSAAYTTLISYFILMVILYRKSELKVFKHIDPKLIYKLIAVLGGLLLIDNYLLKAFLDFNIIIEATIRITIFLGIYALFTVKEIRGFIKVFNGS
ncbi:MAG: oligosaccharide flippase family protein [Bacteroidales bacterium]|nr:oligosaccharide flippase family protein [Bacteroidales bacterium]